MTTDQFTIGFEAGRDAAAKVCDRRSKLGTDKRADDEAAACAMVIRSLSPPAPPQQAGDKCHTYCEPYPNCECGRQSKSVTGLTPPARDTQPVQDGVDAARYRWLQRKSAQVGFDANPWLISSERIDQAMADENRPAQALRG